MYRFQEFFDQTWKPQLNLHAQTAETGHMAELPNPLQKSNLKSIEIKRKNFGNQKIILEIKRKNFGIQNIVSEIKQTIKKSKQITILVILLEHRIIVAYQNLFSFQNKKKSKRNEHLQFLICSSFSTESRLSIYLSFRFVITGTIFLPFEEKPSFTDFSRPKRLQEEQRQRDPANLPAVDLFR